MRYTLLLLLGFALGMPSEASATCFRRSCYGCAGSYSSCYGGCYGCYGTRCYGSCYGARWSGGCYGCYGSTYSAYNHAAYWGTGYGYAQYYQSGTPYSQKPLPPASVNRTSNYYEQGQMDRKVRLEVIVNDPGASIIIDGASTSSTGTTRTYESPELEINKDYTYTVTMKRGTSSQPEGDTRTVLVRAGDKVVIDFTQPSKMLPETIVLPK